MREVYTKKEEITILRREKTVDGFRHKDSCVRLD